MGLSLFTEEEVPVLPQKVQWLYSEKPIPLLHQNIERSTKKNIWLLKKRISIKLFWFFLGSLEDNKLIFK